MSPEPRWPQVPYEHGADRYVFHCDCVGNGHFIEVLWDDEDHEFRWLSIVEGWRPRTWRERVVGIWRMALGREVSGCGVVLDERNTAALQRVLSKHHPHWVANGTTWTLSSSFDTGNAS